MAQSQAARAWRGSRKVSQGVRAHRSKKWRPGALSTVDEDNDAPPLREPTPVRLFGKEGGIALARECSHTGALPETRQAEGQEFGSRRSRSRRSTKRMRKRMMREEAARRESQQATAAEDTPAVPWTLEPLSITTVELAKSGEAGSRNIQDSTRTECAYPIVLSQKKECHTRMYSTQSTQIDR